MEKAWVGFEETIPSPQLEASIKPWVVGGNPSEIIPIFQSKDRLQSLLDDLNAISQDSVNQNGPEVAIQLRQVLQECVENFDKPGFNPEEYAEKMYACSSYAANDAIDAPTINPYKYAELIRGITGNFFVYLQMERSWGYGNLRKIRNADNDPKNNLSEESPAASVIGNSQNGQIDSNGIELGAEGREITEDSEPEPFWGSIATSPEEARAMLNDPATVRAMVDDLKRISDDSVKKNGKTVADGVRAALSALLEDLENNPGGNHLEALLALSDARNEFQKKYDSSGTVHGRLAQACMPGIGKALNEENYISDAWPTFANSQDLETILTDPGKLRAIADNLKEMSDFHSKRKGSPFAEKLQETLGLLIEDIEARPEGDHKAALNDFAKELDSFQASCLQRRNTNPLSVYEGIIFKSITALNSHLQKLGYGISEENIAAENEQQAAGNEQQMAGNEQQAAGNEQQAAGNEQQAAGNKQQAAGNEQQMAGNEQQAAGNGQWTQGMQNYGAYGAGYNMTQNNNAGSNQYYGNSQNYAANQNYANNQGNGWQNYASNQAYGQGQNYGANQYYGAGQNYGANQYYGNTQNNAAGQNYNGQYYASG